MNSNNEPATTSPSEPMSSGSLGKKQIHLKTAPGSVQCSVRLDGLSSTTELSGKSLSISPLNRTTAISTQAQTSTQIETLNQTSIDKVTFHSIRLIEALPTVSINASPLRVTIQLQQAMPFEPGRLVERMGSHGWRGEIKAVEGDRAYVHWGFSSRWIDLSELYPLDEQGKPYIPSKTPSIFEIARKARHTLKSKRPKCHVQQSLFTREMEKD